MAGGSAVPNTPPAKIRTSPFGSSLAPDKLNEEDKAVDKLLEGTNPQDDGVDTQHLTQGTGGIEQEIDKVEGTNPQDGGNSNTASHRVGKGIRARGRRQRRQGLR